MDFFRKSALSIIALAASLCMHAQEFGQQRYSISVDGVYGYNNSWQHHGGADIKFFLPISRYIHISAGVEYLSPKVMSSFITLRPVIPVGSGEILLDVSMAMRPYMVYSDFDLTAAMSIGYRRDYISAQVGLFNRWMGVFGGSEDGAAGSKEPYMLSYRVRACVRPATSSWNIGGGIGNYNDFVYERFWAPMFFVDGYCQVADHLKINASAYIKPAGIFHQVVSFNEITVRAGLAYIF